MTRFVEIEGNYINPDTVALIKSSKPHNYPDGSILFFVGGPADDFLLIKDLTPEQVAEELS